MKHVSRGTSAAPDEGLMELARRCLKDAPTYRAGRISLPMFENSAAAELTDTWRKAELLPGYQQKNQALRNTVGEITEERECYRQVAAEKIGELDRLTRERNALREVVPEEALVAAPDEGLMELVDKLLQAISGDDDVKEDVTRVNFFVILKPWWDRIQIADDFFDRRKAGGLTDKS